MNKMLQSSKSGVSITQMVDKALAKGLKLQASEGEFADRSALENAYIGLVGLLRKEHIQPKPANPEESRILQLYHSGKLADDGFEGPDGDAFLEISWVPVTETLPEIGWLDE
jgi:hypothetical protein